jgi:hypothetical protein
LGWCLFTGRGTNNGFLYGKCDCKKMVLKAAYSEISQKTTGAVYSGSEKAIVKKRVGYGYNLHCKFL